MLRPPSATSNRSSRSRKKKRSGSKSKSKKASGSKSKSKAKLSPKLSAAASQRSISPSNRGSKARLIPETSKTNSKEENKTMSVPVSAGRLLQPSTDREKNEAPSPGINRDSTNRSGLSVRTKLAIEISPLDGK